MALVRKGRMSDKMNPTTIDSLILNESVVPAWARWRSMGGSWDANGKTLVEEGGLARLCEMMERGIFLSSGGPAHHIVVPKRWLLP